MKKFVGFLLLLSCLFTNTVKLDTSEVLEVHKDKYLTGTIMEGGKDYLNLDFRNQTIPATKSIQIRFNNVPRDYVLDSFIIGTEYYQ